MLPAGTRVDRYRVLGPLGRGTTAVVYRASVVDEPDVQVALKVALPGTADDPAARARFLRGARAQATLDHPAIVGVREAGEDPLYGPWVAMELAGPATLATLELPAERALEVVADVAAALDAAHAVGIVHRDVKPANVLVEADRALLADFGLARDGDGLTRSGAVIGTLPYLAPELVRGAQPSAAADRYALAAIAYELLVGEVPFPRATDAAILYAHVGDKVPSASRRRPGVPRAVDAVLTRGLAKRPEARYPDAAAFSAALRQALGATTLPAPPPRADAAAETVEPRPRRVTLVSAFSGRGADAGEPRWRLRRGARSAAGAAAPAAAAAERRITRPEPEQPVTRAPGPAAPPRSRAGLGVARARRSRPPRGPLVAALVVLAAAAAFLATAPFSDDGDAAAPPRSVVTAPLDDGAAAAPLNDGAAAAPLNDGAAAAPLNDGAVTAPLNDGAAAAPLNDGAAAAPLNDGAAAAPPNDDAVTAPPSGDAAVSPGHVVLGSTLQGGPVEGRDCRDRPPSGSSPSCTLLQTDLPGRRLVVPRDGAIRAWTVRGARGELVLQVLRRRDAQIFQVVRSQPVVISNERQRIPASLPARAGDVIGVALLPGARIGVVVNVPGARTERWTDPVSADRGPGARAGFAHDVQLQVDFEPGAILPPPAQVTGAAAARLPEGREVAAGDTVLPDGRRVRVALVEVGRGVHVDLYRGGERRARVLVPDLVAGGIVVEFKPFVSEGNPSQLNVAWRNPRTRSDIYHYFGLDAEALEYYS